VGVFKRLPYPANKLQLCLQSLSFCPAEHTGVAEEIKHNGHRTVSPTHTHRLACGQREHGLQVWFRRIVHIRPCPYNIPCHLKDEPLVWLVAADGGCWCWCWCWWGCCGHTITPVWGFEESINCGFQEFYNSVIIVQRINYRLHCSNRCDNVVGVSVGDNFQYLPIAVL
jgi:hypothetical protein